MSRQVVNRILLGAFVIVLLAMCLIYAKQEYKIRNLTAEQEALQAKSEKIEYIINEYSILVDNVNSRNYVIRIARDMFGWVFDDETVYKKGTDSTPSVIEQ